MVRYSIEISMEAFADLQKVKDSDKKADILKIKKIFLELEMLLKIPHQFTSQTQIPVVALVSYCKLYQTLPQI